MAGWEAHSHFGNILPRAYVSPSIREWGAETEGLEAEAAGAVQLRPDSRAREFVRIVRQLLCGAKRNGALSVRPILLEPMHRKLVHFTTGGET